MLEIWEEKRNKIRIMVIIRETIPNNKIKEIMDIKDKDNINRMLEVNTHLSKTKPNNINLMRRNLINLGINFNKDKTTTIKGPLL